MFGLSDLSILVYMMFGQNACLMNLAWGNRKEIDCIVHLFCQKSWLSLHPEWWRTSIPKLKSTLQKFHCRHHNLDLLPFTEMFSFLYHYQDFYRTWLYTLVTRCLHEHMDWSPVFGGVRVAHCFSVLYFLFCLSVSNVLCIQCCQLLWSVHAWLSLLVCLTFIQSV
jgi:hypothetical protein